MLLWLINKKACYHSFTCFPFGNRQVTTTPQAKNDPRPTDMNPQSLVLGVENWRFSMEREQELKALYYNM